MKYLSEENYSKKPHLYSKNDPYSVLFVLNGRNMIILFFVTHMMTIPDMSNLVVLYRLLLIY